MGVTLNKDGTPRKIGSGKTKGAGCYEKITLRELRKLVNENTEVSVSRVWLRDAKEERKVISKTFEIEPPKVKPEYSKPTKFVEPAKKAENPSPKEPVIKTQIEDEDEYEPPPLFASDAGLRNY